MRFYEIQITAAPGGSSATFSSYPKGVNDPNALNIEMDIPVAAFATPLGGAYVRIWGVSLQQISQASNFNGASIKVYGGMKAGFPLANPAQSGLLVQGTVWQAFGNWVGTSMSLDLIIVADGGGAPDEIKNIVWNWAKGTPMDQAIASTLKTAAPDVDQTINISSDLVLTEDDAGQYDSFSAFAQHVKATSQKIIGGTYAGVDILLSEKTFTIYDGTVKPDPKQIEFNDLIGQPTWIEPNTIQLNCVMRADVKVGSLIKMPVTRVTETQAALSRFRDTSVFQGSFFVGLIRHVGNFRQPDATSWITTIEAYPSA